MGGTCGHPAEVRQRVAPGRIVVAPLVQTGTFTRRTPSQRGA